MQQVWRLHEEVNVPSDERAQGWARMAGGRHAQGWDGMEGTAGCSDFWFWEGPEPGAGRRVLRNPLPWPVATLPSPAAHQGLGALVTTSTQLNQQMNVAAFPGTSVA